MGNADKLGVIFQRASDLDRPLKNRLLKIVAIFHPTLRPPEKWPLKNGSFIFQRPPFIYPHNMKLRLISITSTSISSVAASFFTCFFFLKSNLTVASPAQSRAYPTPIVREKAGKLRQRSYARKASHLFLDQVNKTDFVLMAAKRGSRACTIATPLLRSFPSTFSLLSEPTVCGVRCELESDRRAKFPRFSAAIGVKKA